MHSKTLLSCVALTLLAAASGCSAPDAPGGSEVAVAANALDPNPEIASRVETPVLHGYDDAPRAPDSDDPAIWVNPKNPERSLVIGALKDAGLQVYDLSGRVVQTIMPPNRLPLAAEDPPAPGVQPDPGTTPCPESESGETFGRFNNVSVHYGLRLPDGHGRPREIDVVVVTDRGCDRLRTYRVDPSETGGPLFEITAPDAPRAFPERFVQPWSLQSPSEPSEVVPNPLDDQSTAYGLALYEPRGERNLHAIVTQRSRSLVAEFELVPVAGGRISYEKLREFRFDPVFRIPDPDGRGRIEWTACREDPADDPQFEGLVVDRDHGILYAAQEVVGLWRIDLGRRTSRVVNVSPSQLFEPVLSFGLPYWAVPDDDEFSCEPEEPAELPVGTLVQAGNASAAGQHIEADAEGLAIYYGARGSGYLIASSQGDDTFHVFNRRHVTRHLAAFHIEGTGETDGHEVVNVPVGSHFPFGLFVAQNGEGAPPASTDPINGFEYDNSTHFKLLGWEDIAAPLGLRIDEDSR